MGMLDASALPPGKSRGRNCTGGCVWSRAGLNECGEGKISYTTDAQTPNPPACSESLLRPVASRYNDWAVAAPTP